MLLIQHRVNRSSDLKHTPSGYGVEVDVRHDNRTNRLYVNHDPGDGEDLGEYLKEFQHAFLIFNIKETGVEDRCIGLAERFGIPPTHYFLLDVEHPYRYRASAAGIRQIAIRFSEDEPIEQVLAYRGRVDWVWIDPHTTLPLDSEVIRKLEGFRTCLVSPELWGRPREIMRYRERLHQLNFHPDAVMADRDYLDQWR